ncbi:MAG: polyhydroxyalkanoic acid system family protein [Fibrobacteres bacterium]|nr:polyhydroxyalkanoic acid system family protein [Fibrobacterota bacterium]
MQISIRHKLSESDAAKRIKTRISELKKEYSISGMSTKWKGSTLSFSYKGVEGEMVVSSESVDIEAKVPLLLRPFTGKAEKEIKKELKYILQV